MNYLLLLQCSISMVLPAWTMHLQNDDQAVRFLSGNNDPEGDIADLISAKGYLPSDEQIYDPALKKSNDHDVSFLLSKMSDDELVKLLNSQPNKNEYELNDLVNVALNDNSKVHNDAEPNLILSSNLKKKTSEDTADLMKYNLHKLVEQKSSYESVEPNSRYRTVSSTGSEHGNAFFRLDEKRVDPDSINLGGDSNFAALQKLKNLLYSRPLPTDTADDNVFSSPIDEEEKKEMLFDILVAQLKSLCCKHKPKSQLKRKIKKVVFNLDADADVPSEIMKIAKQNFQSRAQNVHSKPTQSPVNNQLLEHMFLIMNDEIKSNVTDDIISVDPESLNRNSTVLLLGPITTPLSDDQLKLVMNRITTELSKPDYSPLLHQLSDGTLSGNNVGLLKNVVSGPDTRRYIKPHRCNHNAQLSKIYGNPKWLICTGYLNINTPSIYD